MLGLGAGCAQRSGSLADGMSASQGPVHGWLRWRGPNQNGTAMQAGLPEQWEPGGTNHLWSVNLKGRGTPVIADGRVYAWGYVGEGRQLQEVLTCLDPGTGEMIWKSSFNDFLSDIIYNRYSIGAPTVDRETGNVYLMTTPGVLVCYSRDGELQWRHSMMEKFGRMDFPNGRTGSPAVDGNLVIVNTISSNWGRQGAPRNRFYAFDKRTGELVWTSTPGVGPPYLKDSSFSTPVFDTDDQGRRVFYCGSGCGNIVKVNARTGEPIWRYQLAIGGVNSSVVLHKGGETDKLIAIHGKENLDSSKEGRMIALDLSAEPVEEDVPGAPKLGEDAELWRRDGLAMFTSSPTLVGDRVYQFDRKGRLHCLDVETGEELWKKKLGTSQLHASPLWADGKLYVPMIDGTFWILRPGDKGAEVLDEVKLGGDLIGSPSAWNGRVYQFSTERLYCFGSHEGGQTPPAPQVAQRDAEPSEPAQLQPIPSEVLLKPGETQPFWVRALDDRGYFASLVPEPEWSKDEQAPGNLDASFNEDGDLVAAGDAEASAGSFTAKSDGITGSVRGRVVPSIPFERDFEPFELTESHPDKDEQFAHPPLSWIGARFKWDIRERDGGKVLAKTLQRVILQRAVSFIGHPEERGYTVEADVMTEGNRRLMGEVGVINQRYMIVLKGNHQQLEVNSNHERLKVGVPFEIQPETWYRLKTRVDLNDDGSGVIRAKAWPRDEQEPEDWTIEVDHQHAHRRGAPGVFGLAPQNQLRVFLDNIRVTQSEPLSQEESDEEMASGEPESSEKDAEEAAQDGNEAEEQSGEGSDSGEATAEQKEDAA
jgi:outer membrane protein assembly factor BamB